MPAPPRSFRIVTDTAIIGGIMSLGIETLGLACLIVDGASKDMVEIGERTFPLFARGVSHCGPCKDDPGAINAPQFCARSRCSGTPAQNRECRHSVCIAKSATSPVSAQAQAP
jgi:hypothetical protein